MTRDEIFNILQSTAGDSPVEINFYRGGEPVKAEIRARSLRLQYGDQEMEFDLGTSNGDGVSGFLNGPIPEKTTTISDLDNTFRISIKRAHRIIFDQIGTIEEKIKLLRTSSVMTSGSNGEFYLEAHAPDNEWEEFLEYWKIAYGDGPEPQMANPGFTA